MPCAKTPAVCVAPRLSDLADNLICRTEELKEIVAALEGLALSMQK
jgi:hypothetical protein